MRQGPEILTAAGRPAPARPRALALFAALSMILSATLAMILLAALAVEAVAAEPVAASPWRRHEFVSTRLIAAADGLSATGRVRIGLQVELSPGWDTYWRTPGDSGVPTEMDWSDSANLADTEIAWPLPKRLHAFDQDTFVYVSQVVIPVDITADDPTRPLQVDVRVDYGVCREICVPVSDRHGLLIYPASGAAPKATAMADLIEQYSGRVPNRDPSEEFAIDRVSLRDYDGKTILAIVARGNRPLIAPDAFVEGPLPFLFGAPKVMLGENGRRAVLHLAVYGGKPDALIGRDARLTFFDRTGRAIERRITVEDDRSVD